MSEEQIIKACLKGENYARGELYSCYADSLFYICRRYTGNKELAEDLLHDAFIKIFESIQKFQYRGDGSLRAWMVRVTVNVALEYLRTATRNGLSNSEELEKISNYSEPTDEEVERVPQEILMQFIGELPAGYRTIFNLYCVEEYSHKEIAGMLGINEKSSSSQLFRAKTLLAKKIKNYLAIKGE